MNEKITITRLELAIAKKQAVDFVLGQFMANAVEEITDISELVNIARAVADAQKTFIEAEGIDTAPQIC